MTPKEKAREIFDKYYDLQPLWIREPSPKEGITVLAGAKIAKKSALICIDEILSLEIMANIWDAEKLTDLNKYYIEVKQEMENFF